MERRALVIDDSRMMRRSIRHQLEGEGREVEEWDDVIAGQLRKQQVVEILHKAPDPNTPKEALRLLL